jgi:CRP-like cAMP-binding protein
LATHVSNLIIDKLPPSYREHFCSRLEPISLPAGTTLYEPEVIPEYGHFMTSGMTSMVAFMADGAAAEVGVVGSEGVVEGFHVLAPTNTQTVQTRAFVQVPGTALRMRFGELREEFLNAEPLRSLVLGYVQSQAALLGQLSACNRLHEVEERLARWLLMVHDRVAEDRLALTQEFLAMMLGTRRSSVTLAAGSLQRAGLIEYQRGMVHILDRDNLELAACECYPVTRKLFTSLYK